MSDTGGLGQLRSQWVKEEEEEKEVRKEVLYGGQFALSELIKPNYLVLPDLSFSGEHRNVKINNSPANGVQLIAHR